MKIRIDPDEFRNGTALKGKTISRFFANSSELDILFTDGSTFGYVASDGGYGSWCYEPPERKDKIAEASGFKTWEEFQEFMYGKK